MHTPRTVRLLVPALLALVLARCDDTLAPEPGEELPGGATTNQDILGKLAFAQPVANLSSDRSVVFAFGNALFNQPWATAPASPTSRDGLGPTFHVTSCSACHFEDGRVRAPTTDEPLSTTLVRLSIPGVDAHGGPLGEPTYGGQLQPNGILGVSGEGRATIHWTVVSGAYADDTPYELRSPTLVLDALAFGPMAEGTRTSVRAPQAMIGLGLLEAVPEASILALADPDDADGDGISGRPNRVHDVLANATVLGRFGWKAGQPSVRQQCAGAFLGDLGITTPLFPSENCPSAQTACLAAPNGGSPELPMDALDAMTLYARTLAVPVRTHASEPTVLRGREEFRAAGCPSCHVDTLRTGDFPEVPELARQTIHPFTDLLLHDLGEGLADDRPEYEADGREWRTAPLWGLSQLRAVNGHMDLLHDGRARGVAEAILWHGGEAEGAREAFRRLPASARAALVAYVESL